MPIRVELRHLRYLVSAADSGSFTIAAANNNTQISAVSRAVREIEETIGSALFDRLPRGVRLTDVGRTYVASARDILTRLERAERDARKAGSGLPLHLDLGFVWSMTSLPMVAILRSFASEHPTVAVAVVEAGDQDLIERLRAGYLDVVIAATDPPPLPRLKVRDGLLTTALWLEPLVNVVSQSSTLKAATWEDLGKTRLLCRTIDDWPRFVRHVERVGGPTLLFEPHAVSQEGVLGLVAAGFGWTILPASLAHLLPADIRAIPIDSVGATLQVEAIWRAENTNPALTRFFAICQRLYGAKTTLDGLS